MKNTAGKLIVILILFLMVVTTACTQRDDTKKDIKPSVNTILTPEGGTDPETKIGVAPAATKEIPIYTINESTQEVEAATAIINEDTEITPELIVDQVIDSLAERLIDVGVESVTTEKDTVIVSFTGDTPPVSNVDLSVETTILDSIAQSLVDNLPEYPKVIFRVAGEPYQSANLSYDLNGVYLDGNKSK